VYGSLGWSSLCYPCLCPLSMTIHVTGLLFASRHPFLITNTFFFLAFFQGRYLFLADPDTINSVALQIKIRKRAVSTNPAWR
jgi:hypothetical protein